MRGVRVLAQACAALWGDILPCSHQRYTLADLCAPFHCTPKDMRVHRMGDGAAMIKYTREAYADPARLAW
eukprot:990505-Amphidinium_carterae.1